MRTGSRSSSLLGQAEEIREQLVAWRRHLHAHPELSGHEQQTAAWVRDQLLSQGLAPRQPLENAVVVDLGSGPGPLVALRADIDALPIQEDTGLAFASQHRGVMHACGHDGHTAILLGAARLLGTHTLPGRVRLIFQPAEELLPGGAEPLIAAGVLEGVSAIAGLHLWAPLPTGTAVAVPGPAWAAADRFRAVVLGRGGHGGIPHRTLDALEVACRAVGAIQTIVSRRVDPLAAAVVTVGTLHAGDAFNVVAGRAEMEGTVRAFDPAVRDLVQHELERLLRHTAESAGAELELEYLRGDPPLVNHLGVTRTMARVAEDVLGQGQVRSGPREMAADDFACYLQRVPGCYLQLGCGGAEGGVYPHHHPRFDVDEAALPAGVAILTATALELLEGGVPVD